jgi:hypothetical protein
VSVTVAPAVQWVTGEPLWPAAARAVTEGGDQLAFRRPALLRFGSDSFMQDLAQVLQDNPGALEDYRAKPVSFRVPPPGAPEGWTPTPFRLKLYQPLHGDFNLVAASLVCRMRGMPDRAVSPADEERVAFVLRRVGLPGTGVPSGQELAWSADPARPGKKAWLPIPDGREGTVAAEEDLLPMFPVLFHDGGRARRLLVGLVPVSSGETYRSAGRLEPFPPITPGPGTPAGRPEQDPRWDELDQTVIDPLDALIDITVFKNRAIQELREVSAFILLDFADFLVRHVPVVWNGLERNARPAPSAAGQLFQALVSPAPSTGFSWRGPLLDVWSKRMALMGESDGDFVPTANLRDSGLPPRLSSQGDAPGTSSLQGLVRAALPAATPAAVTGTPPDLPVPKIDPTGQATYRIRCLYRRPRCAPVPQARVAVPLNAFTDVVSASSDDFAIAALFDPDAPARDIRIPLPIDTSVRDLRKFRKNVGFVISNQLRGQMNRVTDLKKALDGDLGSAETWDLGMICQFSIPIITICALIILIVFLFLLNIVFFWLPFFKICLPVPVRSKK